MSGVATHSLDEKPPEKRVLVQRRTVRRIIVDYPAQLQTIRGPAEARIVDISERGAKLHFTGAVEPCTNARLRIDGAETYCNVIWSREGKCGLEFVERLKPQTLADVLEHAREEFTPIACTQMIPRGQKRQGRLVCE